MQSKRQLCQITFADRRLYRRPKSLATGWREVGWRRLIQCLREHDRFGRRADFLGSIMRMRWKIYASLGVIALFAVVVMVVVVMTTWFHDDRYNVPQIPFDAAAWRIGDAWQIIKQSNDSRTVRSKMIEDLLHRYQFKGWTRRQVIDLLGQPDERGDAFNRWDLAYVLRLVREGALSMDYEALGFKLDDHDQVKEYRLDID
jgi:hypothetical protein